MKLYLLTTGGGFDGNEWDLHGIYLNRANAEHRKAKGDNYYNEIEEWETEDSVPEPTITRIIAEYERRNIKQ